ncbi:type VI immunity family protein [Phytohabitans flavus]|uniref:type VI immunity family protein n=1 Tax=Phytohabitans flavus TaxID=1076124 RepID=UPI0015672FD5|nr:hypothetical protein [Phytohabitans flavus]
MAGLPLDLQLNVDVPAGNFADVAFDWLDGVSQRLAAEHRKELASLPARVAANKADPHGSLGETALLYGTVEVSRERVDAPAKATERICSDAGLRWLKEELQDFPSSVDLEIGQLDEAGFRSGWSLFLTVRRAAQSPNWLRLHAVVDEDRFNDRVAGPGLQREWLDVMWSYADRLDPGFGQVAYAYSTSGQTALEDRLRPQEYEREYREPEYTVNECRKFLRGYSWLTIVPKELVSKVGGLDGLRQSKAFEEVEELSGGGVWLLATADYRDYAGPVVEEVFRVLAPALRPGTPRPVVRYYPGERPHPLVFEDAASVAPRG